MRKAMLAALLMTAGGLSAAPVTIHGYITAITSPRSFEIDDYRVTRDDTLGFQLENGDYPELVFRPQDLRIGSELEIQGDFNDSTHQLHATAIRVFVSDSIRVKRTAVVEHTANLQRDGTYWTGTLRADAQLIRVDSHTRVILKEYQTNQIAAGMSVAYEGHLNADGTMAATRLEILANQPRRIERRIWHDASAKVTSEGEISISGTKYKLVPDAEAQSFVQRIGTKLVPAFYQQDLSGGAERILPFQFYLIENPDFNAHAFPNGIVLVNSGAFRVLTSEAQLAAVLGHEIAHASQEHTMREMEYRKKSGVSPKAFTEGLRGDAMSSRYSRVLENQADRLGMEYMIGAGYDPREAAEVWRQVARAAHEQKAGLLWSSGEDGTTRRSYLLAELRTRYRAMDFQAYVRNTEQFVTLARRFGNTAAAAPSGEPGSAATDTLRPGYERPLAVPPAQGDGSEDNRYGPNAVSIVSDPAGATVTVNGSIAGKTPMVLPTGKIGMFYVVTVRKPGYFEWTGQLVSVSGRTTLHVELLAAH